MFEQIDHDLKEQSLGQENKDLPCPEKPHPFPIIAQEEPEKELEAVLRWIDEGNPNCQGL